MRGIEKIFMIKMITQIQIGKNGFQEGNYALIKSTLQKHAHIRVKFFKTSEERDKIPKIAEEIKNRLEKELNHKIITKKIGFTLIILKLRKKT